MRSEYEGGEVERIDSLQAEQRSGELTFEQLYDAYFDFVYRLVARLCGEPHPDDLVQEVFWVVHRRLGRFEGRAKVTTWLFRICYRVVGAHIRRERLRRGLLRAANAMWWLGA